MKLNSRQIEPVFNLRYVRSVGSAFLHYKNNKCFFVTAAHILNGAQVGDKIEFRRNDDTWRFFSLSDISFDQDGYDVCAFSLEDFAVSSMYGDYDDVRIPPGAELKFLGFPHGLANTYPGQGYATALLRTAHLSGVTMIANKNVIILDGFNNPGYSGGPVYGPSKSGTPALVGVISGYRFEKASHSKLYKINPDGTEEEVPDIYTKANSGMIYCVPARQAESTAARLTHTIPAVASQPSA